jgi:hypothetical protein
MTEIRFYHGRSLLAKVSTSLKLDRFDGIGAKAAVFGYLKNDLGLQIGPDVAKVSVLRGWDGQYSVKAVLKDTAVIRDINLSNLLK